MRSFYITLEFIGKEKVLPGFSVKRFNREPPDPMEMKRLPVEDMRQLGRINRFLKTKQK